MSSEYTQHIACENNPSQHSTFVCCRCRCGGVRKLPKCISLLALYFKYWISILIVFRCKYFLCIDRKFAHTIPPAWARRKTHSSAIWLRFSGKLFSTRYSNPHIIRNAFPWNSQSCLFKSLSYHRAYIHHILPVNSDSICTECVCLTECQWIVWEALKSTHMEEFPLDFKPSKANTNALSVNSFQF